MCLLNACDFPMFDLRHNFLACFTNFAMVSFNCKHLYSQLSPWIQTKATTVNAIFYPAGEEKMPMKKKISVRQVKKNCSYRFITKRCLHSQEKKNKNVFHRPRPVRMERNWPSVLSTARGLLKTSCTVPSNMDIPAGE